MTRSEHRKPSGCLNTVALVLASITFSLGLWACFAMATGLYPTNGPTGPVCGTDIGTDFYEQCMSHDEELDLNAIEDELQTPTSQERN